MASKVLDRSLWKGLILQSGRNQLFVAVFHNGYLCEFTVGFKCSKLLLHKMLFIVHITLPGRIVTVVSISVPGRSLLPLRLSCYISHRRQDYVKITPAVAETSFNGTLPSCMSRLKANDLPRTYLSVIPRFIGHVTLSNMN